MKMTWKRPIKSAPQWTPNQRYKWPLDARVVIFEKVLWSGVISSFAMFAISLPIIALSIVLGLL